MTTAYHQQLGGLERVRFFPRQMLAADDLRLEQDYHRQRARRHNRYLHGWGVVGGCHIQPAAVSDRPWQIRLCPGYLLTPQGDEVMIPAALTFDIADCALSSGDPCAFARPCPPVTRRALIERTVYLAVRYVECDAHPVRVPGDQCSCDEVRCEYARIRDGYELCCLSNLPKTHVVPDPDCEQLCEGTILPFQSLPDEDPWVVLATITLPDAGVPLTVTHIDELAHRKLLYPVSAVQALARCACQTKPV